MNKITKYLFSLLFVTFFCVLTSCRKEEEMRMPEDILGVWQQNEDTYLQFSDDNICREFSIAYQDDTSIGQWHPEDVYYYEPGYRLVIYLNSEHKANVYEIVELSSGRLTWCWVDDIDVKEADGIEGVGSIIGDIIKKAQEGYKLNPELYESFTKVSEENFLLMLEKLDLITWL